MLRSRGIVRSGDWHSWRSRSLCAPPPSLRQHQNRPTSGQIFVELRRSHAPSTAPCEDQESVSRALESQRLPDAPAYPQPAPTRPCPRLRSGGVRHPRADPRIPVPCGRPDRVVATPGSPTPRGSARGDSPRTPSGRCGRSNDAPGQGRSRTVPVNRLVRVEAVGKRDRLGAKPSTQVVGYLVSDGRH